VSGYRCVTCGQSHDEEASAFLFSLPLYALQIPPGDQARRVDATSDQCVVDGQHFFILGNLDVALRDSSNFIRWSVWTTLSERNFLRASELWNAAGREAEPPYFGWLSNQVPGYPDTLHVKTVVHTQPVGIRPRIEIIEEDHPLWVEQREGISPERFQELLHAAQPK
jgi:hypothetical protein